MKTALILLMTMFLFTACAPKNNVTQTNNSQIEVEDEFSDEFASEEKEMFDPLSGYNEAMTAFNDKFYVYILEPTAKGYKYVLPKPVRKGIKNVFNNLMFPVRFINNVLQLKFKNAGEELGRFAFNSTFGLLGIMDVASMHTDWKEHDEDFGQTLGHYGVGPGFHVVVPFLGPSNVRDLLGSSVDSFADPTFSTSEKSYKIPTNLEKSIGLRAVDTINDTSFRIGQYEKLKKDAIELYPFLRDFYEQQREKAIKE